MIRVAIWMGEFEDGGDALFRNRVSGLCFGELDSGALKGIRTCTPHQICGLGSRETGATLVAIPLRRLGTGLTLGDVRMLRCGRGRRGG